MAYDPSEARDSKGEWSADGGSGDSPKAYLTPGQVNAITMAVKAEAVAQGFDPRKVMVVTEDKTFELNGKELHYAGAAYKDTGNITIHATAANNLTQHTIPGLMAHEIMHQKFNAFLADYRSEREQVMAIPQNSVPVQINTGTDNPRTVMRDAMTPDGTLRAPYDKQFPTYQSYVTLVEQKQGQLIKEDGCTSYSEDWWKEFSGPGKQVWESPGGAKVTLPANSNIVAPEGSKLMGTIGIGLETPIHETLSEMARLHSEKQSLTDKVQGQSRKYLQDKAQAEGRQWGDVDEKRFQKAVKAEVGKTLGPPTVKTNGIKTAKVSKDWTALYKAVNKHWDNLSKSKDPDWYINRYAPKAST